MTAVNGQMRSDQMRQGDFGVIGARSRRTALIMLPLIAVVVTAPACGDDSGRIAELQQENAALRRQLSSTTTTTDVPTTRTAAPTATIEPETTTQSPSTTETMGTPSDVIDAEQVMLGLSAVGLPIADYVVYTEETDPNELLGRPGGYLSKVNFSDARLEQLSDFDIDGGGSVEVFETTAGAQSRYDYVDSITSSMGFLAEYHWITEQVVLRVSNSLTPQQAAEYEGRLPEVLERLAAGETFDGLTVPEAVPVEPVAAVDPLSSPFLGGTNVPLLGEGTEGELEVVATGTFDGTALPVMVRNRTPEGLLRVEVSATARNSNGEILATGSDHGLSPNVVEPGDVTFGYIYFGRMDLPPDVTFDFVVEAEATDGSIAAFENIRDLEVVNHRVAGNQLVGEARNMHSVTVEGPIRVSVVCFNEVGDLVGYHGGFTDQDSVAAGELLPFAVRLRGNCFGYLVALSGYER